MFKISIYIGYSQGSNSYKVLSDAEEARKNSAPSMGKIIHIDEFVLGEKAKRIYAIRIDDSKSSQ